MKHITATTAAAVAVIVCCSLVGGCSSAQKKEEKARAQVGDVLGPGAVFVLSDPSRVEGWNFQRPDGTIITDPPIQELDVSAGKDLAKVLLDRDTYALPARGGGFERAVGYRFSRAGQSVEFYLSFNNDQVYVKYPGASGAGAPSWSVGFTNARDAMLRAVHKAFPGYRAPGAPKVKAKG
jgi:hypothetical protein